MTMKMLKRQRGIRVQEDSMIAIQIRELNKNGIYPLELKAKMNMIIVKSEDLEKATALKIDKNITIGCYA